MIRGLGTMRGSREGRVQLRPRPGVNGEVAAPATHKHTISARMIGNQVQAKALYQTGQRITANPLGPGPSTGPSAGAPMTGQFADNLSGVLDRIIGPVTPNVMRLLARDMYKFDPICTKTVDLTATLLASDFTVTNADKKALPIYETAADNLNLRDLMPDAGRDVSVTGMLVGALGWSAETRNFEEYLPLLPENVRLVPMPFYGAEPLIEIQNAGNLSNSVRELAKNEDIRQVFDQLRGTPIGTMLRLDNSVQQQKSGGGSQQRLDPSVAIYVARRCFTTDTEGTSILQCLFPLWIMEKSVIKGTTAIFGRRQSPLIQAKVGSDEVPALPEQLDDIANVIQQADQDPVSAVLATRHDIDISEVTQGANSAYKWTELADILTPLKLKGLGMSESLMAGDVSLSTMDAVLSVFVQNVRTLRDMLTFRIHGRVFLQLAYEYGFKAKRDNVNKIVASPNVDDAARVAMGLPFFAGDLFRNSVRAGVSNLYVDNQRVSPRDYDLPTVTYTSRLRPEADPTYSDLLKGAEEAGLPVPLRAFAVAAGLNYDELMKGRHEDLEDRKKLAAYLKLKEKLLPQMGEEGVQGSVNQKVLAYLLSQDPTLNRPAAPQFNPEDSLIRLDSRGHRIHIPAGQQKLENERVNKIILAAKANADARERYVLRMASNPSGFIHVGGSHGTQPIL